MKKIFILFTLLTTSIFATAHAQDCFPEGIIFTNQKQIDDFPINHPECISVQGSVTIRNDGSSQIRNLDSLFQILSIDGDLKIWKNDYLENLNGLKNLNFIGGNLDISLNPYLNNFKGLENLSTINGNLKVSFNSSLTSLKGLDNISVIDNNLSIRSNNALLNLDGLLNIVSVMGRVGIINNNLLHSLIGLNSLITVGSDLAIISNKSLSSLNGLESLTSIGGNLSIKENDDLAKMDGLSDIISVSGKTEVNDNHSLLDLKIMNNIIVEDEKHELRPVKSQEVDVQKEVAKKEDVFDTKDIVQMKKKSKNNKRKRSQNYDVWVTYKGHLSVSQGYLREIKDSSIVLSNNNNRLETYFNTQSIAVKDIKTIQYRSKDRIVKGILIGAVTGIAAALLISKTIIAGGKQKDTIVGQVGDVFDKASRVYAVLAIGAIGGPVIGGLIGSAKVVLPIHGNHRTMKNQREKLQKIMSFD